MHFHFDDSNVSCTSPRSLENLQECNHIRITRERITYHTQHFEQHHRYAIRNGETPTISRMKGIVMFETCQNVFYEFHLSGSTKRQRVRYLFLSFTYSERTHSYTTNKSHSCHSLLCSSLATIPLECYARTQVQLLRLDVIRSRKTRIVAIGPGLDVKRSREFMSRLLQDCCVVEDEKRVVVSSWQRLVRTDKHFIMSRNGFFSLAEPEDMNRKDLSTRYGIDFDSLLDEFVCRVNMSNLPVLFLCNVMLNEDDDDDDSRLYAVSACPLGYETNEKALLDIWSRISEISNLSVRRMLKQIPSCRCDI